MITTAVQQASQTVEVQGAPPSTHATSDDFLAALAANVGGSQKLEQGSGKAVSNIIAAYGFQSSMKQSLPDELLTRSTVTTADSVENGGSETASLSGSKASSDLGDELGKSDAANSELVAKPVADSANPTVALPVVKAGVAVAKVPAETVELVTSEASEAAKSGKLAKSAASAKSADAVTARSRKEVAGLSPDFSPASQTVLSSTEVQTESIAVATASVIQLTTIATLPAVKSQTLEGTSLTQNGSKAGVLASFSEASDLAITSSANAASNDRGKDFAEVTVDQEGSKGLDVAKGEAPASQRTASAGNLRSAIVTPPLAGAAGSSTLSAVAAAAVSEATNAAQGGASSVSISNAVSMRNGSSSVESWGPKVDRQGPVTAACASTVVEKALIASQQVAGNIATAAEAQPVDVGAKIAVALPTDEAAAQASGLQTTAGKLPATADVQRTPGAAATSVKSEKTKTVAAASEDATVTQSSAVQSTPSHWVNNAASDVASVLPSGPVRTLNGIDGGSPSPAPVVASHTVDASSRPGGVAGGTISAAHAVGTASLSETAAAGAQVSEPHRTLLATPTTLEVGVPGGTQGWLRIRAEVGDQGGVNASLKSGSTAGRELLHSQMPALNAFLHSERMAVTTTVTDRESATVGSGQGGTSLGSGGQASQDGSNGSLLQGGGAQSSDNSRQSKQESGGLSVSEMRRSYDPGDEMDQAGGPVAGRTMLSGDRGRWLNVRV